MDKITLIGTIAATCTTISFLPQVIKIYKTKHTRDISLPMYLIFALGVICWVYYGILVRSIPIIIANITIFVLCCFVLFMKIRYDN